MPAGRTKTIRILLLNMPKIMASIVAGIVLGCDNIKIVDGAVAAHGIFGAVSAAKADIVVLGDGSGSDEDYEAILYQRPRLKIIALSADGRRGFIHELRPRVQMIADLSADSLIAAIRGNGGAADRMVLR
jgi:hypothetical protein